MAIILMLPGELAPTRVVSWEQRYARRVPALHCREGRRIWRNTCMNRYQGLDRRFPMFCCRLSPTENAKKELGAPTGAPSERRACAHAPASAGAWFGSIVSTESCGLILNQAT